MQSNFIQWTLFDSAIECISSCLAAFRLSQRIHEEIEKEKQNIFNIFFDNPSFQKQFHEHILLKFIFH